MKIYYNLYDEDGYFSIYRMSTDKTKIKPHQGYPVQVWDTEEIKTMEVSDITGKMIKL